MLLAIVVALPGSACRRGYDAIALSPEDAGGGAADAAPDARGPEGARDCTRDLPGTLAVYDFESLAGGVVTDSLGDLDGTATGTEISSLTGPPGCGQAIHFSADNNTDHESQGHVENGDPSESFVIVPDASPWQLVEGSIDFWLRLDACRAGGTAGVITRDASGYSSSGHLALQVVAGCELKLIIEQASGGFSIQSTALSTGEWHHIGINFTDHDWQLWIDGVDVRSFDWRGAGISGNSNPWVIGAETDISDDGSAHPLRRFLVDTAIDRVRISSVVRDFR